jgi:hypothetical protein
MAAGGVSLSKQRKWRVRRSGHRWSWRISERSSHRGIIHMKENCGKQNNSDHRVINNKRKTA